MPLSPADELAILQLVARYNHLTDFGADGWEQLFTDDGVFETGPTPANRLEGREQLAEYAQTLAAPPMQIRHATSNSIVEGDGDEATHTSYLMVTLADGVPLAATMGSYRDRLRRVDGEWRFAERRIEFSSITSRESLARRRAAQAAEAS